jgi:AraC-like DNA-binding protein
MQLAYRYLRDEGASVKEVATRVGFDDPFYFSRVFKRVMCRTPGSVG